MDELAITQAMILTEELRTNDLLRWVQLRDRLEDEGVSVSDAAVGDLHPEDRGLLFGVVVTRTGRRFTFTFEFLVDQDGSRLEDPEKGWLREWREWDPSSERYAREASWGSGALDLEGKSR